MGLFDFKKPKWQHKDPAVRLKAVHEIDPKETEIFERLVLEDPDPAVRLAAINQLTDVAILTGLENKAPSEDRPAIVARWQDLLYDQIAVSKDSDEWQTELARITSADLLAKLAVNAEMPEVRLGAVDRIDDQHLLAGILRQNCGKKPALAALAKITDESLLTELSESAANKAVRRTAAERVAAAEKEQQEIDREEIVHKRLHALKSEAEGLLVNPDMDGAAVRMAALGQEWQKLDSRRLHPAADDFSSICRDFEERYRQVQEQRKAEQKKTAGYAEFQSRLEEICSIIERVSCSAEGNAPSVKKQAVEDWAAVVDDPGQELLPDPALAKRFADACRTFDSNRPRIEAEKQIVDPLEEKCVEISRLLEQSRPDKAAARLAEVKKGVARLELKFFSKTSLEKVVTELADQLDRAQEDIRARNLARRREICEKLEQLRQVAKPHKVERQLQELKQDWQQLARIEDDQARELARRYEQLVTELTEKVHGLQHEQDWHLWANLTLKEKLAERVTALDQENDLEKVVAAIKEAQAEWKKIGPVPHKESEQLWDTFHGACNRNFERAKPYLDELAAQREEAMARRREICDLTADLTESEEWQKTAAVIKGFQKEWKNLPHGSRNEERKLYKRFRQSCDRFFERRKEHYRQLDELRSGNLVEKKKLCEQAEQLAAEPQLDYPGEFKRLQAQWKKTGPVPHKHSDAIWKRFRAACDRYFDWLSEQQQENLARKEKLCEEAERLLAESTAESDPQEIAEALTGLQQQWKEIGPVPPGRDEELWQRFRRPSDQFYGARQEQFEKEEEERRTNQEQKEDLLARATELAGGETNKETTERLKELQQKWFEIGPAPRGVNRELDNRFKALCDAFFDGRRQYFADLRAEQLDNQKQKESLCLRLENILGLERKADADRKGKALSLAEELKLAMEDNFMLAGRRNERKDVSEEVRRIQDEWQKIGPVPPRQIRPLAQRYKKALDAYYKSRRGGENK